MPMPILMAPVSFTASASGTKGVMAVGVVDPRTGNNPVTSDEVFITGRASTAKMENIEDGTFWSPESVEIIGTEVVYTFPSGSMTTIFVKFYAPAFDPAVRLYGGGWMGAMFNEVV